MRSCPLIASTLLLASSVARAQDSGLGEQQRLFQRMVREPTKYDITFEFVRVATANEDYEAAIGALERLLYYEPTLTRVKYELGILYYRLRSFEMAKHYFTEALKSPDLDPVTRERIATYLPDADKMTQASRFSGFAQLGLRYQSNANFSPNTGAIRLNGADLALLPAGSRTGTRSGFSASRTTTIFRTSAATSSRRASPAMPRSSSSWPISTSPCSTSAQVRG